MGPPAPSFRLAPRGTRVEPPGAAELEWASSPGMTGLFPGGGGHGQRPSVLDHFTTISGQLCWGRDIKDAQELPVSLPPSLPRAAPALAMGPESFPNPQSRCSPTGQDAVGLCSQHLLAHSPTASHRVKDPTTGTPEGLLRSHVMAPHHQQLPWLLGGGSPSRSVLSLGAAPGHTPPTVPSLLPVSAPQGCCCDEQGADPKDPCPQPVREQFCWVQRQV